MIWRRVQGGTGARANALALPGPPGPPSYLPSVPQHGVPRLGELLSTDDPKHQLLLELTGQRVLGVGVEDA